MRRIVVSFSLVAGLVAAAGVAHAQQSVATVDPGMTKAQVVERLGTPATERSHGEHTYLFFQNQCERRCGTPDLVMLRGDSVIDAIFRSPQRRYTGTSSSPASRDPVAARRSTGSGPLALPSAPANDASTPEPVRASTVVRGDSAAAKASNAEASSATPAKLASTTPAAAAKPAEPELVPWPPAEAVRALPRADTIKGSPAASAARSDTAVAPWPPPGATPAKEPAPAAADSSRAAPAPSATWPPPRVKPSADSGAAPPKPPED